MRRAARPPDAIRRRFNAILEGEKTRDTSGKLMQRIIIGLIVANAVAVTVETLPDVRVHWEGVLHAFEVFSLAMFSVEYALRLWSCPGAWRSSSSALGGRVRFALRPSMLIDLAAILPSIISLAGIDLRFLRVIRLFRFVRVFKIIRYSRASRLIADGFHARRYELGVALAFLSFLLFIAAALIYHVEHEAQPKVFSSIPAAMWWAVITLTTVGYGDMYPVTSVGKVVASGIAILGIGLFALPAGLLGAAFSEQMARSKRDPRRCPHCGKSFEQG